MNYSMHRQTRQTYKRQNILQVSCNSSGSCDSSGELCLFQLTVCLTMYHVFWLHYGKYLLACCFLQFGKGIYFADMSSKSANYCYATRTKNIGLLLLSEVS